MEEFHRDYTLKNGRYEIELWSGTEGIWGEVTLPSAAKIPIRLLNEGPISLLTARREVSGVYADFEMIRDTQEILSPEIREAVRLASNDFHNWSRCPQTKS